MLGIDLADKVTIRTFGEDLSFLERMILQSLRGEGGLARLGGSLSDILGPGKLGAVPFPAPLLIEALRQDGTLAAVELLDGRPVAMMPFWIRVR
jgi:hypothetical protein